MQILINAALGFDTFMVMRHGHRKNVSVEKKETPTTNTVRIPGDQLGCYYCSDVVAPGNVCMLDPLILHVHYTPDFVVIRLKIVAPPGFVVEVNRWKSP